MSKFYWLLFCLILVAFTPTRSQDLRATTDDGRTVILKKTGVWFFIDRSERQNGSATLQDGRTVTLEKNGKWSFSNDKRSSSTSSDELDQRPNDNPAPSAEADKFYNSKYHFSIKPPTGWKAEQRSAESIRWNHPAELPGNIIQNLISLDIQRLPPNVVLDEFVSRFITHNAIKDLLPEFLESESGTGSISGIEARLLVFRRVTSVRSLKTKLYIFIRGQEGYALALTSSLEEYPLYLDLFDQLAQSFQFE